MSQEAHFSVMLNESIDALQIKPNGRYVDGTFGRGGHSRKIVEQLGPEGRLLAFDKDPVAIECANEEFKGDERFQIAHASFADLLTEAEARGLLPLDGILLDLGVSSPQLDEAERGFSFMKDGPLDMRMDPTRGESAAEWLARAEHGEMARVFREYGEEKFAGPIANAILRALEEGPITTTGQLAKIVSEGTPKKDKNKHPATRVFQAIRIFVNNELGDVESVLAQSVEALAVEGRLVVISFHSLEDRIVKQFIKKQSKGKPIPRGVPVMGDPELGPIKPESKALKASAEEIAENVRSRSAVMRIASKRLVD